MKITFDPAKRASTLTDRSLDFADAIEVFAGKALNIPDDRRDYGEPRIYHHRVATERMVIVAWTPRGNG